MPILPDLQEDISKEKDAMKQAKLPIAPPIINRKCQFGACQEDLAFVIAGVDLCFEHGKIELNRRFIAELDKQDAPQPNQLELIK